MEWSKEFFAGYFQMYGPIFHIISALFEQLFDIKSDKEAFELKHLLLFNFFYFGNLFFKIIVQDLTTNFFRYFLYLFTFHLQEYLQSYFII